MSKHPKYAHLTLPSGSAGTAVRLEGDQYIRDRGHWSVGYKSEGGKLLSVSGSSYLDGVEIVEISQSDWEADNAEPAPTVRGKVTEPEESA